MLCQHCEELMAVTVVLVQGNAFKFEIAVCEGCCWYYMLDEQSYSMLWLEFDRAMCSIAD